MNIPQDIYYIKLAREVEYFLADNKIVHWPIDLDYDYDRNRADVTIEIKKDKLDDLEELKMFSTILAKLNYELSHTGLRAEVLYGHLTVVPMENEDSVTFHICFIC
jgi:hypothetical protein